MRKEATDIARRLSHSAPRSALGVLLSRALSSAWVTGECTIMDAADNYRIGT